MPLRFYFHAGQDVRVEIEFIVVRVGMGAGNVLHHIHGVAVQVDIIFAVGVRANFHRADQLVA